MSNNVGRLGRQYTASQINETRLSRGRQNSNPLGIDIEALAKLKDPENMLADSDLKMPGESHASDFTRMRDENSQQEIKANVEAGEVKETERDEQPNGLRRGTHVGKKPTDE